MRRSTAFQSLMEVNDRSPLRATAGPDPKPTVANIWSGHSPRKPRNGERPFVMADRRYSIERRGSRQRNFIRRKAWVDYSNHRSGNRRDADGEIERGCYARCGNETVTTVSKAFDVDADHALVVELERHPLPRQHFLHMANNHFHDSGMGDQRCAFQLAALRLAKKVEHPPF